MNGFQSHRIVKERLTADLHFLLGYADFLGIMRSLCCSKSSMFFGLIISSMMMWSCLSAPPPVEEKKDDVWTLIQAGKTEEARQRFLGENNVHTRDTEGKTPLIVACENDNIELARFFIALGADVNVKDNAGQTPLEFACKNNSSELVELLAKSGASLFLLGSENKTPLDYALENRGILNSLLHNGNIDSKDGGERTALHIAARAGNIEAVTLILSKNAQTNIRDKAGNTCLDAAFSNPLSKSHASCAELLILAGALSSNSEFAYFLPAIRSANYNLRFEDNLTALHYASRLGHLGIIQFLLDKKADTRAKSSSGAPPLHEAIRSGQLEAARLLIQAGAEVNAKDAKGNTAMHLVMPLAFRQAGLELLLSHNADPNFKDDFGDAPLHIAISMDMGEHYINTLLNGNADPNIRNTEGKTPLHTCLEKSRFKYIAALLAANADIYAADNKGITPFEIALNKNDAVLTESLLDSRTVKASDNRGYTALHMAIEAGVDSSLLIMILDKHADVNARNKSGDTALHIAIRKNQRESGELLLARNADIFATNSQGQSPLYLAAYAENGFSPWMLNSTTIEKRDSLGNTILHHIASWKLDSEIKSILEKGVNIEALNSSGETALFYAVKANSPSTIDSLVRYGASPKTRDALGNTALHAAIRWNAPLAAKALLEAGIDANAQNLAGKTPLHEAVKLGMADQERLLMGYGAKLEIRDTLGNTPLMEAVQAGLTASSARMLERGANASTRNINGDTPLHIAISMANKDIVQLLLHKNASIHAVNASGLSPLKIAMMTNQDLTLALLADGRVNQTDDTGFSPIHIAVQELLSPDILRAICKNGANLSDIDAKGRTAITMAMEMNALSQARVLVECGANIFIATDKDVSALSIALEKGIEALKILTQSTNMAATDRLGNTALHYAAYKGSPETVKLLLEYGASKTVRNLAGETPQDLALRWGKTENEKLLAQ